jgi:subtilase family serine protease
MTNGGAEPPKSRKIDSTTLGLGSLAMEPRMTEQRMFSRTIAIVSLAAIAAAAPLAAQSDRITGPIDSSRNATLPGHVNPNARAEFDQGPVDDAFPLTGMALALKPSDAQQADLTALLAAQQDPASADYHNWLTPDQFAARFGASLGDIAQITAWLEGQGFVVQGVAPSRNWITFSGSAGLARRSFGAEIHRYQVNGEPHFATAGEPTAPAAFAGLVAGIRGLDDFLPRAPRPLRPAYTAASGNHYLVPEDAQTIYDLKSLYQAGYDGSGQKLVVAGQSAIELTDVQTFRSMFGLPKNDPKVVPVPGIPDPGVVKGDVVEADLDVEWAGAIAKSASLIFVYSRDAFDAVQYAVAQNLAPVVSLSYGTCETGTPFTAGVLRLIAQQANAQGITWIASSGDSGAFGCESSTAATAVKGTAASLPASIPEVTGVGGTSFNEGTGTYWNKSNDAIFGSALSYIPETSWNDTAAANPLEASGGGPSAIYAKPSWQTGTGVPNDGARDVPDVAMAAGVHHDGAIVCTGGSCANGLSSTPTVVGGTSLSTQMFAGIAALVNHYQVGTGAAKAGLANMNPTLYAMAGKYLDAFHDVVSGNNVEPCRAGTHGCTTGSFGYQAGAGYDLVTGLGSVDANTLAVSWKLIPAAPVTLSSASISPATLSGGGSATVTVDLTGAAPSGGATVTLSSSNASAFPAPASILVAAGLTTASAKVKAAQVTTPASVTVTAEYNTVIKTASVTIAAVVLPNLTAVAVTPSSVVGGATAILAITLSGPAPTGGASVSLSSNSAAFPVPASVMVPARANGVQLSVRTASVTASTPVTVTATYNGTSKTAGVTVTPAVLPNLTSVTITPSSVTGGSSVTLAVTLSGPAPPGGATVKLSSSNATVLPAPATIVVPAGQASIFAAASSASVKVKTTQVTASTSVTVTATYNGASKTAGVTVTPAVLPNLTSVTITPSSVTGGSSITLAVTLSGPAPPGGATVKLSSSNATVLPAPATIVVPAGQASILAAPSSASVKVKTTQVTASTSVTVTATYNGASKTASVTVAPLVLPSLTSVTVTPSVASGTLAALEITLSGPAPAGGASVSLKSSDAAFPVPASISIRAGMSDGGLYALTKTVPASTPVTVTATYNGASKTASFTLMAAVLPSLTSLTVTPSSLTGGSAAELVIGLSGFPPPGGPPVTLSSSSAAFPVPASVTNLGTGGVLFFVRTTAVTVTTSVTVTATYNGASKTANVTLLPAVQK